MVHIVTVFICHTDSLDDKKTIFEYEDCFSLALFQSCDWSHKWSKAWPYKHYCAEWLPITNATPLSWCLKSSATWLSVQQFPQAKTKRTSKSCITSLWRECTSQFSSQQKSTNVKAFPCHNHIMFWVHENYIQIIFHDVCSMKYEHTVKSLI